MDVKEEPTTQEPSNNNVQSPSAKPVSKKPARKKKVLHEGSYDPTKLEDSPVQVLDRFKHGCECQDDCCFGGLSPDIVYRHRLNIAELTKAEHDMYLMGVTMACLTNPLETAKHNKRRRLRTQYSYQGRRVCLDAFLYLENCTHYQIKRIRKHLVTHGVTPRVHGNHGKVPHNTFSLDIYQIATEFLKEFVKKQELKQKTKNATIHLPSEITRKNVHDWYTEYCRQISPDIKIMGYSTFRGFISQQFPQVKFAAKAEVSSETREKKPVETAIVVEDARELLPVVITQPRDSKTYLVTPINKLQSNYQLASDDVNVNGTRFLTITSINTV